MSLWHLRAIGCPAQGSYIFHQESDWPDFLIGGWPSTGRREVRSLSSIGGKINEVPVANLLQHLWNDERGQDIAEYAVMLAVILVIVVGTIRLIGSNANNVFSQVGSSIQ